MNPYRLLFFGTLAALVIVVVASVGYLVGRGAAPSPAEASAARTAARQLAFDAARARAVATARVRGRADGFRAGREAGRASGTRAGRAAAKREETHRASARRVATASPNATGSLTRAAAKVASLGYTASDTSTYGPGNELHVLIGIRTGSADGYGRQAFFFHGDDYLGTDTSDPSAAMSVAWQDSAMVAINYSLYNTDDAYCCPTGSATVRYQWNGSRLVPLDPIPPSENVNGSRL